MTDQPNGVPTIDDLLSECDRRRWNYRLEHSYDRDAQAWHPTVTLSYGAISVTVRQSMWMRGVLAQAVDAMAVAAEDRRKVRIA